MKLIRELKVILESASTARKRSPAAALCADFKSRFTMDECEKLISWVKGDANLTPALAKKVREVTRQSDLDEVGDEWFSEYVKDNGADAALKSIRELIYKDKLGLGPESKKDAEKIVDTLLASTDDESTFRRYYNQFMREHPDTMDLVLDELFTKLGVKTAEQLFNKAFK